MSSRLRPEYACGRHVVRSKRAYGQFLPESVLNNDGYIWSVVLMPVALCVATPAHPNCRSSNRHCHYELVDQHMVCMFLIAWIGCKGQNRRVALRYHLSQS